MATEKRFIEVYEKVCRWCKYFRGVNDPVLCDSNEPCLSRKGLEEMQKEVEEERE